MTFTRYARLFKYLNIHAIHRINTIVTTTWKTSWSYQLIQKKSFDKIQYPLMIKMIRKLGMEGNFPNLMKNIYRIPTANITLKGKRFSLYNLQ